jgi:tetratricopeptide (TPR) repeat protein/transcriptional regulator with XRE-family HTH domain
LATADDPAVRAYAVGGPTGLFADFGVVLTVPGNGTAKRGNAARGAARRRLAERRKALGLTQEALADLLGVERTTVVRWERGETAPAPPIRPKLARALRVPTDRLEELLTPDAPGGLERADPDTGTRPRQLPSAVPQFTGRTAELEALTKVLDGAGALVTVVISAIDGTAGVGKTALAIQWAHQAADRFPDGQLYANLRGYDRDRPTPPGDALAGFLRALGVGGQDIPPEEDERAARYRSLLAGRRILVVLDNAGSAEQVRPLLPGSPTCTVVVTSRDSLTGLVARDGAVRVDLDLLPLADAVRLLRDLIGGRAAADPGATETLAERCCRLPLALRVAAELAAARPEVPLSHLAGELADQQQLLDLLDAGGDSRTAVRAVFSWSYQHLDADVARGFRLAGLHPGADFDLYALAALADSDLGQAGQMLDVLARAHLVQPAGPGRYAMHDLLRAYATELAVIHDGDDGQHAALTRLADLYLSTAATAMDTLYPAGRHRRPRVDRAGTPAPPVSDAARARSWLDGERAALTAVIQYAAGHGLPGHATRLSATLGTYFISGGHYPEAIVIFTSARLAAREQGDRAAEGLAVNALGVIDANQGRNLQATERYLEARELFRQASDYPGEARALNNLGSIHTELGRYQEAIGFLEQGLSAFRRTGDRLGEAMTLVNLGHIMGRHGHYQQGTRLIGQSLRISQEIGDMQHECWALLGLGDVALMREDYEQADDLLRQGLVLSRTDGDRINEIRALTRIGDLRRHQGRTEAAAAHLRAALAICRELGDHSNEAVALNRLGEVHLAEGRAADARDQLAAALGLVTENGDIPEQARARESLGNACHALGDTGQAGRHWREALALYADLGVPEAARVRARLDGMRPGG